MCLMPTETFLFEVNKKMKKLILYIIATLGLALMIIQPVTGASATVPILQPKEVTNTFKPTSIGKNSYYIVQPDSNIPSSVYTGSVPGTFTGSSSGSLSYGKSSVQYLTEDSISSSYSSAGSIPSANPFINELFPVPKAVQIDNTNSSLIYKETTPFSIHIDQSLTFFGESGKVYYALLDQTGNIVLDIDVKDSSATANLFIYSNTHLLFSRFGITRASIPVLANDEHYIFVIQVSGADSLVTVAPHVLNNNQLTSESVNVNNSAKFNVNQGECFISANNKLSGTENLVTKFNLFNLPDQSNNYYSIYLDIQNLDKSNTGCNNYGSIFSYLLNQTNDGSNSDPFRSMTNAQIISGSLDQNSLTLRALNTGTLQLVLESIGHLNSDVTVFFRQITTPKPQTQEVPIPINKATRIYTNVYNTFTVPQNSVLAVNFTGGVYNPEVLSFYSYNSSAMVWNYITDFSQTVSGNLLTTNTNTINYHNYMYLPSGTYGIMNYDSSTNLKFTINIIPITIIDGATSESVQINNQSVYAFQPTVTNYIQFQLFNLTSQTHDNFTVQYEYAIIGKYNEGVNVKQSTSSFIGNKRYANGWQGYTTNNSNILVNDKYSTIVAPIVILHPIGATNASSLSTVTSYSTQLTIKTSLYNQNNWGQIERINVPPVTTKTTFNTKNDGFSNTYEIYYWIPLATDANSLYNVTIFTSGNYTNSNRNLTIYSFGTTVTGGKYSNLNTGFNDITINNATTSLLSQLLLTQSNPSYLSLILDRGNNGNYVNGTFTVQITKLSVGSMNFPNALYNNLNTLTWNKTVSTFEVADNSILFSVVTPGGSAPGFEIFIAVIGLGMLPIAKKFKDKYRK